MKELVVFTSLPKDMVLGVMKKLFIGVAFERMTWDEPAMWFKFEDAIVSLYILNELKAALQELDAKIQDSDIQMFI